MIIITDEQKSFLSKYVENLDELLSAGKLGDLLTAVDDAIIDNIISNDVESDEPNEIGIIIQKYYDQIYNQNIKN